MMCYHGLLTYEWISVRIPTIRSVSCEVIDHTLCERPKRKINIPCYLHVEEPECAMNEGTCQSDLVNRGPTLSEAVKRSSLILLMRAR
jgi:hypothetical protein